MDRCTRCGSYAINEHLHGREKGKHPDLCDVCYWRAEAEAWKDEAGRDQRNASESQRESVEHLDKIERALKAIEEGDTFYAPEGVISYMEEILRGKPHTPA